MRPSHKWIPCPSDEKQFCDHCGIPIVPREEVTPSPFTWARLICSRCTELVPAYPPDSAYPKMDCLECGETICAYHLDPEKLSARMESHVRTWHPEIAQVQMNEKIQPLRKIFADLIAETRTSRNQNKVTLSSSTWEGCQAGIYFVGESLLSAMESLGCNRSEEILMACRASDDSTLQPKVDTLTQLMASYARKVQTSTF